jgi:signal peptidase I
MTPATPRPADGDDGCPPHAATPGAGPASWTPPPWVPPRRERTHRTVDEPAAFTPDGARVSADRPPRTPTGPGRGRRWARIVLITTVVLAAAALIRIFVAAPYYIPSASMEPTLHGCSHCDDDHVLVDKLSYRVHAVHRGDVVVFDRPSSWAISEKHLIKRVIALPGDTLSVRQGALYVNGARLVEPYLKSGCGPIQTLDSRSAAAVRTLGPVPAGEVFVMGDNRCDSADSRMFGPVPISDIVGRAFLIVWPLGRLHWL